MKLIFVKKVIVIFMLLLVGIEFFIQTTYAYETSCPSGMSDDDCIKFLQEESAKIRNDQGQINSSINQEQYQQLDIEQKIRYLTDQISTKEKSINVMEINIETKNVEIRILGRNIDAIQENINTLKQETTQLKENIAQKVSLSYKYDKVSPIEVILSTDSLETMLRKTKYLLEARKHDRDDLEQLSYNALTLQSEQTDLNNKKADAQKKRSEIEIQKTDIFTQKQGLNPQKAELDDLLAESKKRESDLVAQREALSKIMNDVDSQTLALIMKKIGDGKLPNGTYVQKGQTIGLQGHTGCAFGSHLHFGMNQGWANWGNSSLNPFSGYLNLNGDNISTGNASSPLDGAYLTQGFHAGMFVDMISTRAGDQSGNSYYVKPGDIACSPGTSGPYPLKGEGAPIYAIYSGTVRYDTDGYGGKYAYILHDNGLFSMYLHLK